MSDAGFDLDAYLRRIAYRGPREPSPDTLAGIIACHAATLPFENIDVFLGRPIRFDPASVTAKLVHGGRGGYCFEQNALLRAGLTALGFRASPRLARVIRGLPDDAETPRTHMILNVDLPDGAFLADVGFGNLTPTGPLAWRQSEPQPTRHEPFRILRRGREHVVQAGIGSDWQSLYRVCPDLPVQADLEVANWFTATNPAAPFVNNLIIARPGDACRQTLFNSRFASRDFAGNSTTQALDEPDAYRTVLRETFGLTLPEADLAAMIAKIEQRAALVPSHGFFA